MKTILRGSRNLVQANGREKTESGFFRFTLETLSLKECSQVVILSIKRRGEYSPGKQNCFMKMLSGIGFPGHQAAESFWP